MTLSIVCYPYLSRGAFIYPTAWPSFLFTYPPEEVSILGMAVDIYVGIVGECKREYKHEEGGGGGRREREREGERP
jgi:hypothetical protein